MDNPRRAPQRLSSTSRIRKPRLQHIRQIRKDNIIPLLRPTIKTNRLPMALGRITRLQTGDQHRRVPDSRRDRVLPARMAERHLSAVHAPVALDILQQVGFGTVPDLRVRAAPRADHAGAVPEVTALVAGCRRAGEAVAVELPEEARWFLADDGDARVDGGGRAGAGGGGGLGAEGGGAVGAGGERVNGFGG